MSTIVQSICKYRTIKLNFKWKRKLLLDHTDVNIKAVNFNIETVILGIQIIQKISDNTFRIRKPLILV